MGENVENLPKLEKKIRKICENRLEMKKKMIKLSKINQKLRKNVENQV